jgi:SAM-dependent methyltransferase
VSFSVPGDAYDRLVGRYSRRLAPLFLEFTGVAAGPVVEVGCGPGALTEVLAARLGAGNVAAVDPSPTFVTACRARVPGADVRLSGAEALPFAAGSFSSAFSQLVLSFVADPARTMAESVRVVRPGGTIAACTWEGDGFRAAMAFWRAALELDPGAPDDAHLPFRREEELTVLWRAAGLRDLATSRIDVEATYAGFADYWEPMAAGAGPMGDYLARQPASRREELRERTFRMLGSPPGAFTLGARALAIRGTR